MGERFVGGVDHLANLKDVVFEAVADKDVLVYDAANAKWKNLSFEGLIAEIEANIEHQHITVDNNVFELGEDSVLKLVGFDGAEAGAMLSKTADGKAAWIIPSVDLSELAGDIEALEEGLAAAEEKITNLEGSVALKANAADVYTKGEVDTVVGGINEAVALKANVTDVYTKGEVDTAINGVNEAIALKANAADVYTKEEVENVVNEAVVAADHLKRVVVESVEAIDVDAEDALLYIYMVPTGTVYGDDKYDEYLVIEEEDGTRKVERVGSWEVDLSNYATVEVVNGLTDRVAAVESGKADKATTLAGYGITDAYTKEETLTKIEEKITEVNGGESAGEVLAQLNSYKETNDARVKTLEEKVETLDDGAEVNVVNSVEETEFNLVDRHLSIKEVAASKVTGLAQHEALVALNDAIGVNTTAIANNKTALEEVTAALNNYVLAETYNKDISEIKEAITWQSL